MGNRDTHKNINTNEKIFDELIELKEQFKKENNINISNGDFVGILVKSYRKKYSE